MKRGKLAGLLAMVLFALCVGTGSANSDRPGNTGIEQGDIPSLLSHEGSGIERLQITGWTQANGFRMSLQALETMAVSSVNGAFPGQRYSVSSDETEHIRQVKILWSEDAVQYEATFHNSLQPGESGDYETYVVLQAVAEFAFDTAGSLVKERIKDFLRQYTDSPQAAVTYIAAIPGELSARAMDRISHRIFCGMGAQLKEEIRDGGLVSKTGYSRGIEEHMTTEKGPMNLNVALRYNAYEDKTYIWLGIPIITGSY